MVQSETGNTGFALEASSSPSPSSSHSPSETCPADMPISLWRSVARGMAASVNCYGYGFLGPDYATWQAEDIYNQDKEAKIETCNDSGGTAIIGSRIWTPGRNSCTTMVNGFEVHDTAASVTCCGTSDTSPSPSPEQGANCATAFGPNYSDHSRHFLIGNGSNVSCTVAKDESLTEYNAQLSAAETGCPGKTIVYDVRSSSRCSHFAGNGNSHQRTGHFKCCIDLSSPSPTQSPTQSPSPGPTVSPSTGPS